MNNIPYIDILILAMVAVFIINRLRNTLGKKTGNEHDLADKFTRKSDLKESSPDKVSKAKFDKVSQENLRQVRKSIIILNEVTVFSGFGLVIKK